MNAKDIKALAWIVGSSITALGVTVLAGSAWGHFAMIVGPLVAGAFGVTGPIHKEEADETR